MRKVKQWLRKQWLLIVYRLEIEPYYTEHGEAILESHNAMIDKIKSIQVDKEDGGE